MNKHVAARIEHVVKLRVGPFFCMPHLLSQDIPHINEEVIRLGCQIYQLQHPVAGENIPRKTKVIVFTDGACRNNGKENAQASIGIYWGENNPLNVSRRLVDTPVTNNTAELTAILEALMMFQEHFPGCTLDLYTDSELCYNTFTKWAGSWEKRGWTKMDGNEIKNVRLIQQSWDILKTNSNDIKLFHCRSHQPPPPNTDSKVYTIWRGNQAADQLAKEALSEGKII